MKRLIILAALALAACTPTPPQSTGAPVTLADRTIADEKLALAAETIYTGASMAGELLVASDKMTPAQYRAIDSLAYTALQGVRSAYRAGNSASVSAGMLQLTLAANQIYQFGKDMPK